MQDTLSARNVIRRKTFSLLEQILVWDADRGSAADATVKNRSSVCVREPINKSGAGITQRCEALSRKLLPLHC